MAISSPQARPMLPIIMVWEVKQAWVVEWSEQHEVVRERNEFFIIQELNKTVDAIVKLTGAGQGGSLSEKRSEI